MEGAASLTYPPHPSPRTGTAHRGEYHRPQELP